MNKQDAIKLLEKISKEIDLINPGEAYKNCAEIDAKIEEIKISNVDKVEIEYVIARLLVK